MKFSFGVLMGILVLLCVSIVGGAVQADPVTIGVFLKDHASVMMVGPAIISASITPELINDMKVKFGRIKVITVVVESPVYDIDNLTFEDRVSFKKLGVDYAIILNKMLLIEDRLKPLEALKELRDDINVGNLAAVLYSKYTGKVIEPGEQYQFLAKRPDRGLIKMLLPLAEARQIDDFSDKAVKNLIVGGDMNMLEDGIVYMGVVSQLRQMISPEQSFLANA